MGVEAIALTDFVHGDIDAIAGRLVKHRDGTLVNEFTARDLESAGLIRIRTRAPAPQAPSAEGKAADDGQGQPSSASPAAPASQPMTSDSLKPGANRIRKPGA